MNRIKVYSSLISLLILGVVLVFILISRAIYYDSI